MKPFAVAIALTGLFATGAVAQAPAPSDRSEASLAGGTMLNAMLNSSIDSKKAKPGEQIIAHTTEPVKSTDGRMILPSGTKIIGHVTQASARTNGQGQAMLALQFDKAVLKDKQEMPLNVVIQAIAAPAQSASPGFNDSGRATAGAGSSAPSNNPSMSGSRGARPEGTPPTDSYPTGNTNGTYGGESNSAGPLPANMKGVYGLDGVHISANANGEGTVLTSTAKSVHLDGGTRLLLSVQPQSASAAPSGK